MHSSSSTSLSESLSPDAQNEDTPRPRFRVLGWFARFLLVPVVCVVAFLLASVPARNSLLWMHLASGREIARQGPFAAPAALTYGVENPSPSSSWLYDLAAHQLYQLAGGAGFMVVHALLVALLVLLVVAKCRAPGDNLFLPGVGALVAALALGPWVTPGPLVVSALLLAATLLLLDRIREGSRAAVGQLIAVFLLWANVDSWFVLGLAVVALQALGALLTRSSSSAARSPASLLLVTLAGGTAASLINPLFVSAFRLPMLLGLSPVARLLRHDPLGNELVLSPLTSGFWESSIGSSPAGVAFAVLVVVGLLSFVVNRRRDLLHLLPWLAVTGLVLWQSRLVPLFVVVAAPTLIRNLRESASEYRFAPEQLAVLRFVAILVLLAAVALPVLAWPGWLQSGPYEPRQWKLEPDPALVRMAATVRDLRDQGRIGPDEHVFATTLEAGHHLVWLCPGEVVLLDGRFDQYPARAARDYLDLRAALRGAATSSGDSLTALRQQHGIGYVLLADRDNDSFGRTFALLSRENDWVMAALEGQVCLFAAPDEAGKPGLPPLDLVHFAVDPPPDRRAPDERPVRLPPSWTDPFLRSQRPRSADRDEARLHLSLYDQAHGEYLQGHRVLWEVSLMAALAGTGANPPDPVAVGCSVAVRGHLLLSGIRLPGAKSDVQVSLTAPEELAVRMRAGYVARRDQGPMGNLYLAIRASRRALHDNPDDSVAWLLLGQAYWRLLTRSQERGSDMPQLRALRVAQAGTALNKAIQLRPDLAEAHELLFSLYGLMGYRDLQLEHAQALLRLRREAKPTGDGAEQSRRLEGLTEDVAKFRQEVESLRTVHIANTVNQRILLRAQDAMRRGLAKRALEILLTSDTAAFGPAGAVMELDLLILVGRAEEAREWLTEDLQESLGYQNYYWLRALIHAGEGDMREFHDDLQTLLSRGDTLPSPGNQQVTVRTAIGLGLGQMVLGYRPPVAGPGQFALQVANQIEAIEQQRGTVGLLRKEGAMYTLRGLLALEQGDGKGAREYIRKARAIAKSGIAMPAHDLVLWWDSVFAQGETPR